MELAQPKHRLGGMTGFTVVWLGQIVSILASGMTQFALTIWMYNQTKSALALGLMQVFYITPFLLISPFAGVMVDRYNRKLMMMVSDMVAALGTFMVLILWSQGALQFWHLYIVSALIGIGNAFQWPAYSAAITTMVSKEQYGRANGLMGLMESGPGVFSPLLAGALLPIVGLTGILVFDVTTFFLALGALLLVFVPPPPKTVEGQKESGNFLREAAYGFTYIFQRPSLLGLQIVFLFANLFSGIAFTLIAPMILASTGSSPSALGAVNTAAAVGGVVGGIAVSIWGVLKRKVHGVLAGWLLTGFGFSLFALGGSVPAWVVMAFLTTMIGPLINASNQTIWQAKVAPDIQGRVFSARRLIAWATNPISPIIAGSLADFWLTPAMQSSTALAATFGPIFGTSAGSGMSLLIFFCGLGISLTGASAYFFKAVRNAEDILPDHDTLAQVEEPGAEPEPGPLGELESAGGGE
jgi:predicted MFS family arabinose efflux permease